MTEQIGSLLRTHDFLIQRINRYRYLLTRIDAELQMFQMVLASVSIQAEAIQHLSEQQEDDEEWW